jgi:hypothetical protein
MGQGDECNHRSSEIGHARHAHHVRFHHPFDAGVLTRDVRLGWNGGGIGRKRCEERRRYALHHVYWSSGTMMQFSCGLSWSRFQRCDTLCQGQRGGIYSEIYRASFQTGRAEFLWMFEGFPIFINLEEDVAMHADVDTGPSAWLLGLAS